MLKSYKAIIIWVLAAAVCIVMLCLRPEAAEFQFGPGDHYDGSGNIVSLDGTILVRADGTVVKGARSDAGTIRMTPGESAAVSAAASEHAGKAVGSDRNYKTENTSDGTVYVFEGRKYKKSRYYGEQKLTGYAEAESGSARTYSGKTAAAHHTVSAPSDIPMGSVIIVEGVRGPYPSEFDGVYVVEDRGGAALENGRLIDIFCGSLEEAEHITDAGWNYADIWIAEPV